MRLEEETERTHHEVHEGSKRISDADPPSPFLVRLWRTSFADYAERSDKFQVLFDRRGPEDVVAFAVSIIKNILVVLAAVVFEIKSPTIEDKIIALALVS